MQERYFPLVNILVSNIGQKSEFYSGRAYGFGFLTPHEAHEFGLTIPSDPHISKDGSGTITKTTYTNRVQALWVPVQ